MGPHALKRRDECSTTLVDVLTSDGVVQPFLVVDGVGYRRSDEWLFRGLSFAVQRQECWWLRGHNGRGKTSLLRLVVQLATPDEGAIAWPASAQGVALPPVYIGHTNALKDDLTAQEALQFLVHLHGRSCSASQAAAALQRLGIHKRRNQPVRTLSQGQRRRVALSRLALESSASLWVLDEPYDALDPEGIAQVNALMQEHQARGGSVILTSHIPVAVEGAKVQVLNLEAPLSTVTSA